MFDIFDPETVRLLLLVLFSAFVLFFVLYGFFAVYHVVRYSFKGDLAIPSIFIFLGAAGFLIVVTYLALLGTPASGLGTGTL